MTAKSRHDWRFWGLALAGVVFTSGCNPESGTGRLNGADGADGGAADFDAGVPTGNEGLADGDVTMFLANPDREGLVTSVSAGAPPEFDAATVGADAAYLQVASECYAPSSGPVCGGTSCDLLAACCVDDGDCCSPVASPPLGPAIDFTACDGLTVAQCASDAGTTASVFGATAPVISAEGLTPNGSLFADSGAVFGDAVDLGTHRVDVDMRFTAPGTCAGSCLESIGVGFVSTASIGDQELVEPEVALLYSAAFESVSLVLNGEAVQGWPAASVSWSLVLKPEGQLEVIRDATVVSARAFNAKALRTAHFVVYGRNLNAPSNHAALQSLGVTVSLCDISDAWDESVPVGLQGRRPSIASNGSTRRLAVDVQGEIFWAAQSGSPTSFTPIGAEAALSPTREYEAAGVRDAELVWDGTQWHLFYTAVSLSGARTIGHATAGPSDEQFVADSAPTLTAPSGTLHIEAPAIYHRPGLWVMVARVERSGESELRLFETAMLGLGWAPIDASALSSLTRVATGQGDVTDPTIIVHDSAYQLYVAKRVGTLWSIVLFTSDELLAWRSIGSVLSDPATFGAREAAAISDNDRIDLYYVADHGAASALRFTGRTAASDSVPVP